MSDLLKKYKDMANTRGDYNNVNTRHFMLPTMGEMIEEDLMNDLLKQFIDEDVNNDFTNQSHLDAAYYVEQPFSTTPGYHDAEAAFVLRTKNLHEAAKDATWEYNHYDGDTTAYLINDIDDGNESFTFNDGKTYRSFKDYYKKMGGSKAITIRHAGIDAPEIPHYVIQAVPKHNKNFLIEEMTYKEVKDLMSKNNKVLYVKHPVNSDKTKVVPRKNDDKMKLLKMVDENNKIVYFELIEKLDSTKIDGAHEDYEYYKMLGKEDESTSGTIIDGYKAQTELKQMMESASEILLVVDANQLSVDRLAKVNKTFNSIYYGFDAIDDLIKEWNKSYRDLPATNFSYVPYGMDKYTRSMGVVYIKTDLDGKPAWINLNKYIAANVKSTETNPDYNSSPELQEMKSGMTEVFELWSYDQDNIEWLDSFNSLTKQSYEKRINLHKQLSGIDFTQERDCALLIGDTMMLVPPESIRNITQVGYERIPNMRSKGTMAKQMGQNEHMLELVLYFYGEDGLNGIPYKHTFPNGTQQTYYMNGLRSLISQFKVTPYLPIENGYINDVLGIEAVSLMNMNIETVKGFPRLYRVVLSLREFNYRTFMPDLPVDDEFGEKQGKLSQLNPMFAKSFDWDMFRYYYQKGINAGQQLAVIADQDGYGSYSWNLQFYTNKNTIGPYTPCGLGELDSSSVSFYIPDENWLEQALQLKKQRDSYAMSNFAGVKLSVNAEEFLNELALLDEAINKLRNTDIIEDPENENGEVEIDKKVKNFEYQVSQLVSQHGQGNKNIILKIPMKWSGLTSIEKIDDYTENIGDSIRYSNVYIQDGSKKIDGKSFQNTYVSHIYNAFRDAINNPRYMKGLVLNERVRGKKDGSITVTWEFNIRLNTDGITDEDMLAIREVLSKDAGVDMSTVFVDNIVKVNYNMYFKPCIVLSSGEIVPFINGEKPSHAILIAGSSNTSTTDTFVYSDSTDTKALSAIEKVFAQLDSEDENSDKVLTDTDEATNAQNSAIDYYIKDYKNPANMPFVPYVENVLAEQMGSTMGNTFTDISLKAIEGVGPQYLGGQDVVIELSLVTDDIVVVSALNNLPNMASSLAKRYKRILPAWPLKIRSALTDMLGVSEVLVDAVEVSTIEGLPGVYSISMRLTSVDRTQRQREALRRLDVKPNGGKVDYNGHSNLAMKDFFEVESSLAQAELYPDLDLPTIKELAKLGYRFVKYSGKNRSFVDPDFYIRYAYPYTSLIIKKLVNESLSKQLFNTDVSNSLHRFTLKDTLGAEVTSKVEAYTGLEVDEIKDGPAKTYEETLNKLTTDVSKILKGKLGDTKQVEKAEDIIELSNIMKFLTMCDVNDGWEIKPGWRAPLCSEPTNTAVRDLTKEDKIAQDNVYAKEIKEKRKKALRLIDNILGKPLSYDGIMDNVPEFTPKVVADAVNRMFSEGDGKALIQLLCPGLEIKPAKIDKGSIVTGTNDSLTFNSKYFKDPTPLNYLVGYAYAAGCALSGHEEYRIDSTVNKWGPNHHGFGSEITNAVYAEDQPNTYMPYCVVDRVEGKSTLASRIDAAIANGTCFGAYRITKYSSAAVVAEIADRTDNSIMYGGHYYDATYKDKDDETEGKKFTKAGFLDPYYNYLNDKEDNAELKTYKEKILLSRSANTEAFLRIMLVHLRKLILDGLLFSEIDIIANTYDKLYKQIADYNSFNQTVVTNIYGGQTATIDTDMGHALKQIGFNDEEMRTLLGSIKESNERSFCARLAYPFLTAITKGSSDIYDSLLHRDYDSLNALTGYIQGGDQNSESRSTVIKFLAALSGIDLTATKEGKNESHVSESQMLANNMMKDIFIQAAEDPKAYVLHSFYDMLVNDRRGRLVRAFPTYYVVFVDEGRKIGSWKLHDNFYNMNSISHIQVVKSRKIAADTCTITMNNMFNSYTMEPDITTTQQYTDIYGLRDVYNSIFSPQIYFEKEKRIRLRQTVPDKVVLQPGVRIHVRMGYSADGSKLPIVFNGKVAEVDVADVAQIVAQGDGHELMNPLNAFGEMEVTSLDPAQSAVTWFKDIRGSLAGGGETPRDLLAKLLTAKHGGWKKVANKWFDGRWFNDNPFGITHFGDPRFNNIFELGEPVQNLYEVADETLIKGTNELYVKNNANKVSPIINTSLQDKTLWDILHLCANTGLGYIGAVRDFGFRSTVFLGRPNHYYAYAYELMDGKVIEKRKPFQQFHYYDSYNDIIYNSIKASEAQMKTNAVGLWQSSSMLWGREQSTVGPIYLDMNIYPEYQKSMTVDTGLLAAGNGGIDIPFIDHFAEEWNLSPNDNKVNKSTAWRVTANALKNSVKDMYQGDVAVIGDPSVKPFDRCYIYDTYEDMMGQFEVEAVVHTMSVDTGFTTSIMPDVIARHDDKYEASTQGLLSSTTSMMSLMIAGNIAEKLWTINVNNKLTTALAKSRGLYGATTNLNKMAKTLSNAPGMQSYLEKHPNAKTLFEELSFTPSQVSLDINRTNRLIDELAEMTLDGSLDDNLKHFAKIFSKYQELDINNYQDAIEQAIKNDKYGFADKENLKDKDNIFDNMTGLKNKLDGKINTENLDLNKFKADIIGDLELYNKLKLDSEAGKILRDWKALDKVEVNDDTLKQFSRLLSNSDIQDALGKKTLKVNGLDEMFDSFKTLFKSSNHLFRNAKDVLKGQGLIDDILKVVKGLVKFNWATILTDIALNTLVFIITKNTQSVFTRWLQGIQAIDVYPLKKNGKPLIAGMNGHKGSVYGFPVVEGYDSIQGMVLQTINGIKSLDGNFPIQWADGLVDLFVDPGVLEKLSYDWRKDLGLEVTPEELEKYGKDEDGNPIYTEDLTQELYNSISSQYASNANHAYAVMTRYRKQSFDTKKRTDPVYKQYEIDGVAPSNVATNEKVRKLYYIHRDDDIWRAIIDEKLVVSHAKKNNTLLTIPFERGTEKVPVLYEKGIFDTPLLQEDALFVLKSLVKDKSITGKIHFKSGARFNDIKYTWKTTGFAFTVDYKGSNKKFKEALDNLIEDTRLGDRKLFAYGQSGDLFTITVYAPVDTSQN